MPLTQILSALVVRDLGGVMREIEAFPDDASVWELRPGVTNSAGTLALHLVGNLNHYIGHYLGQTGYVRDRPREFSTTGVSRAELSAMLAATREMIATVLPRVTEEHLDLPYPEPHGGRTIPTRAFLVHVATHLAFHLGQIGYLRRIVTGQNHSVGPLSALVPPEA